MLETSYEILCHYRETEPKKLGLYFANNSKPREDNLFYPHEVLDLRGVDFEDSGLIGCYVEH